MSGIVLVVEDDAAIRAVLEMALSEAGYRVILAVGAEALTLVRVQRPDVILLDIMMPGMSGVEVSQRLRADPATAQIPIVAMSALHRLEGTATLMAADDHLPKPFRISDLYATVARWVRASPPSRTLRSPPLCR